MTTETERTPEEQEKIKQTIANMAETAKDWDDEMFARSTVSLLIFDEGNLNKYQRTLELVFKVHAAVISQELNQLRIDVKDQAASSVTEILKRHKVESERDTLKATLRELNKTHADLQARTTLLEQELKGAKADLERIYDATGMR